MMSFTVRERASIAHTHQWCGPDLHGHELAIAATVEGHQDTIGVDTIGDALRAVVHEIDRKDLSASVLGSDGSIWALAAWVYDRIAMSHRALSSVSIGFLDGAAVAVYRRSA